MWNCNSYSRKFWANSTCKYDQGKAILDGIEFRIIKIIYKDICIKEHGLWGCGLVHTSMSLSILRSTIVANAFSSDLETHKGHIFSMIAPWRVAKLSTSPKVTILPSPVPCNFISDQCLKGDRWTTLFLRNSIVAKDLKSLPTHKIWNILRGETYVSIHLLATTHLVLYRLKYINPIWSGGTNHPPSYKKCYNFCKANDIDLKLYDFS